MLLKNEAHFFFADRANQIEIYVIIRKKCNAKSDGNLKAEKIFSAKECELFFFSNFHKQTLRKCWILLQVLRIIKNVNSLENIHKTVL